MAISRLDALFDWLVCFTQIILAVIHGSCYRDSVLRPYIVKSIPRSSAFSFYSAQNEGVTAETSIDSFEGPVLGLNISLASRVSLYRS